MPVQHTCKPKHLALAIALAIGVVDFSMAQQPTFELETKHEIEPDALLSALETFVKNPTTVPIKITKAYKATDGVALQLDDSNHLVTVQGKGSFTGLVDGGGGENILQFDASKEGTLENSRNFLALEVKQGTWTRSGDGDFEVGALVRPKATLINKGNILGGALAQGNLINRGTIGGRVDVFEGGDLLNKGLIAGAVHVRERGHYAGSGVAETLNVHGRLSVGQRHGAPRVSKDLQLSPTATLAYEVNATGKSETLFVEGVANLGNSTLELQTAGDYPSSSQHTIITAGKVEGRFAKVENPLAFMTADVQYNEKDVGLTYSRNEVKLESVATSDNSHALAASIEESSIPLPGPTPDAIAVIRANDVAKPSTPQLPKRANAAVAAILTSDKKTAPVALEQLAAGSNANLAKATLSSITPVSASMLSAMQQLNSRYGSAYSSGNSPRQAAGAADSGRVWIQALGHGGKVDRDFDSTLKHATQGLVMGADWRLNEQWHIGLVGGKSQTSLDARQYDGDLDSWHLGAYAVRQDGPFSLRLGATYASHDGDSKRRVAFNGFSDRLKGNYDANTQQAFAELAVNVGRHNATLEPFASLGYQRYQRDSYSEKGGDAALKVFGQTRDNLSSTFGLRTAKITRLDNGMTLTPRFSAGWKHTFGEIESDTRQQLVKGGKRFEIAGAALDRNSLSVDAGLDLGLSANHTVGLGLTGEMATDSRTHGVMGQWRMAF
ncbi:autotransporter outer membrane beta-barrel domain-containing protein [Pseudomonas sp. A34-9]|uniref:autotransporter outer membrane beta-barrel domain-containing protein n=1 Tax=Pseudomonas sp. A34-9 TaxID=3034675 RepID=UPI00240DAF74|nr:autotransporter outer membrane beta-barrel domain-containing protein [Pseudomonas sp. A34-9]